MTLWLSRLVMAMSDAHLAGITRPSSCTSIVVGDSDKRPAILTAHLPASCTSRMTGRHGTYTAGRCHCRNTLPPATCTISGRRSHRPTHHRSMPSIIRHTITPMFHTTKEEVGAYKESNPPLSHSLFIERSERLPHCLLEIPLAMPWPKQTLRFANRTYSPHNNYLPIPRRLPPIYYSCVCAPIAKPSPASPRNPSLAPPPTHLWPGHTITDRRDLSPGNEDPAHHVCLGRRNQRPCGQGGRHPLEPRPPGRHRREIHSPQLRFCPRPSPGLLQTNKGG